MIFSILTIYSPASLFYLFVGNNIYINYCTIVTNINNEYKQYWHIQNVDKLGYGVTFFNDDFLGPVIQHCLQATHQHNMSNPCVSVRKHGQQFSISWVVSKLCFAQQISYQELSTNWHMSNSCPGRWSQILAFQCLPISSKKPIGDRKINRKRNKWANRQARHIMQLISLGKLSEMCEHWQ